VRAAAENSLSRFEQAKADALQAIPVSPRPNIGIAYVAIGDGETRPRLCRRSDPKYHNAIDFGLRRFYVYTNLAAAYAQAGRMDEAKATCAEAAGLTPQSRSNG
jgi:hypothetical protein